MCRADQKTMTTKRTQTRYCWATLELADPDGDGFCDKVKSAAIQIMCELRILKQKSDAEYAFLSIVDVSAARSWVILCGGNSLGR